jgi:HAD superfamily hydrolase (TIGR01509 family)
MEMEKENIKGILFDLDGVLFDSEYYQWQGWVEPLRKYGIELTKEMYFNYAGKNGRKIDQELIKDFDLGLADGELLAQKTPLLEKWFHEKALPLMPFANEAVEFFSKNPKFKLGLCSGGDREEVMVKLEKNDFVRYFPVIVGGDDVLNSKPAPDIYIEGAKRLGLLPEECLAIEDTQYGLQAAKSAGLSCFAVPNEYSIKQDFSRADQVFGSLEEIINYFNQ